MRFHQQRCRGLAVLTRQRLNDVAVGNRRRVRGGGGRGGRAWAGLHARLLIAHVRGSLVFVTENVHD